MRGFLLATILLVTHSLHAKSWYQAGRSDTEMKRDLAGCKAQSLLAGSSGTSLHARVSDGARQVSFVRLCMEANGYTYGEAPPAPVVSSTTPPQQSTSPATSNSPVLAAVTGHEAPGLKVGFRDLKWGDSVPPNMTFKSDDGQYKTYVRPSDSLSVGPVSAIAIEYHFVSGQLFGVGLRFKGSDLAALRPFLELSWGPEEAVPGQTNEVSWYARHSGADDSVALLDWDPQSAFLFICNRTRVMRFKQEPQPGAGL